jgi:single-strand DNA-binding protein
MAVNELSLTVVGWVGSEPTLHVNDEGRVPFTKFRLASTPRVYDREQDAYVDAPTNWFTVKAFRSLASNVAASVRRGDPVVVHGRLRLDDWTSPEGHTRTTAELVAEAVGHDLGRGRTDFMRTVHDGGQAGSHAAGAAGGAADGRAADAEAAAGEGLRLAAPVDLSGATVLDDEPATGT